MGCEKEISLRIEKIKTIFQVSRDLTLTSPDLKELILQLDQTEPEFRSAAYEGASMGIALNDLNKNEILTSWNLFAERAPAHAVQIHVGLGWAVAQQNYSVLPFFGITDVLLSSRVLDGYGYYDGIFRQRSSIKGQKIPEAIQPEMLSSYDQGIGRSLWYISKGDVTKIHELVSAFSLERRAALWTGIGVACAYVGGCDKDLLTSLFESAQELQNNLITGAMLATKSRLQASALTEDVKLAYNTWSKAGDHNLWLSQIEKVTIPTLI
ncbi:MAG: hypothetical protein K0S26_1165 [Bacteroidota bacterium]|nr:hypothetical protein [Bacteroidota bacterium]